MSKVDTKIEGKALSYLVHMHRFFFWAGVREWIKNTILELLVAPFFYIHKLFRKKPVTGVTRLVLDEDAWTKMKVKNMREGWKTFKRRYLDWIGHLLHFLFGRTGYPVKTVKWVDEFGGSYCDFIDEERDLKPTRFYKPWNTYLVRWYRLIPKFPFVQHSVPMDYTFIYKDQARNFIETFDHMRQNIANKYEQLWIYRRIYEMSLPEGEPRPTFDEVKEKLRKLDDERRRSYAYDRGPDPELASSASTTQGGGAGGTDGSETPG